MPLWDWEVVTALSSSAPKKATTSVGHNAPCARRKTAVLDPSAKPIEAGQAKRRRRPRSAGGSAEARERFARTFADVLSGRFGGRWSVKWERADSPSNTDQ